ncbi:MAG: sodium:solute symporter family protein, partial [Acidobacteriota bacterium]
MTLAIVIAYLAAVLVVGLASQRFARGSGGEDFFVASRSIGAFVLLMTLFGTHMTSFALLGASGEAYRVGVGVYSLMASSSAILAPLLFLFVGTRVWQLGRRFGYVTQVQYVRDRWGADVPGLFLFVILVLLMIPYLLIGVMGGGLTLTQITDGAVPGWVGSLMIATVVLSYVSFGGLRGTAWVNTFQTSLFMVLGGLTAVVIIRSLGGVGIAVERLQTEAPELLIRGDRVSEIRMLSYTLIPASVGMFPHIFMHWLSARSAQTFRAPVIFYPLCIAAVWIPSVLLGLFGNLDFPGLEGPAANSVLVRMIALHAPEALAGLLGAGVFAAIMSSLDSQSLSLGTMFAHDVVGHYRL